NTPPSTHENTPSYGIHSVFGACSLFVAYRFSQSPGSGQDGQRSPQTTNAQCNQLSGNTSTIPAGSGSLPQTLSLGQLPHRVNLPPSAAHPFSEFLRPLPRRVKHP